MTIPKRLPVEPPAGARVAPARPTPGVRQSALRHLRRILATTAATGAALGMVACESNVKVFGHGTGGAGGSGHTGGSGNEGAYGGEIVCDALPPPLECSDDPKTSYFSEWIYWYATWDLSGDTTAIKVELTINLWGSEGTLTFSDDPVLTGGMLGSVEREEHTLSFQVWPLGGGGGGGAGGGTPDPASVGMVIPLECNAIAEALELRLDIQGPPVQGEAVPIAVDDE